MPGSPRFIEYEAKLNEFFPGCKYLALCQYDRRRFTPTVLLDVLRTHPIVVMNGELYDNFYYVPPAKMLDPDIASATFCQWQEQLKQRKRTDEGLHQAHDELEMRVGQRTAELTKVNEELQAEIVEHRLAEQELLEIQQRMQALMDSAPVGVSFSEDTTCHRITGNRTVLAQFEVQPKDNLSASAPDASAPGRQVRYFCQGRQVADAELPLQRAVAENRTIPPMDLEIELPSGKRWSCEASGAPVRDARGNVIGGVAVSADITERKRAEGALLESEARFRRVVEHISDALIVDDVDGRVLFANDRFLELFGVDQERMGALMLEDYVAPEYRRELRDRHDRRVRGEIVPTRFEYEGIRCDGRRLWLEVDVAPIQGADGRSTGTQSVIRDITDRKRAEEALRESEDRFRQVVENLSEVLWLTDWRKRELLYVSPSYETVYGRSRQSIFENRRSWIDVIHLADRARVDRVFAEKGERGEYAEEEYRIIRPDGSTRWVRDRSFPIRDDRGEVYRWVGVAEDITERKLAEHELEQYRHHLEDVVEERTRELKATREQVRRSERLASLGTLAAGIAHEINNPVGGILLAAESALASGDASEPLASTLQDIIRNTQRCKAIVQNIRRFARAERMDKTPGDINAVVRGAAELIETYLTEHGSILQVLLGECPPKLVMNAVALEQVLVNLIRNAVEAGADRITLQTRTAPQAVEIIVADDGSGISPEHQSHLFDPFFTTRQSSGGSGLGLSIAHSIIQDHGGTIEVSNAADHRATFTIRLPLTNPTAS